jgi:hypothetical protein
LQKEEVMERYDVYVTFGENGYYYSQKVDTFDSVEQASERVFELQAMGNNATYERVTF